MVDVGDDDVDAEEGEGEALGDLLRVMKGMCASICARWARVKCAGEEESARSSVIVYVLGIFGVRGIFVERGEGIGEASAATHPLSEPGS